jgi:hypothetical protein
MNPLVQALLLIGGSSLLSVLGLLLVRRRVSVEFLETHHEVGGLFMVTYGTLYAVLLAFAVFVVWTDFKEAESNLELEANELADLYRMSQAFPDPFSTQIQNALLGYLTSVLNDEFPAMAEGRESPRTFDALQNIWNVYRTGGPTDSKSQVFYEKSIERLNEMGNNRRLRILKSHGTVPTILWCLLNSGAILLVGFTYFFGLKNLRSQALMTAALAGFLAFSLYLIYALNLPFAGLARVSPEPLQQELRIVQTHSKR